MGNSQIVKVRKLANGVWNWAAQHVLIDTKAAQVDHVSDFFRNGASKSVIPTVTENRTAMQI